MVSAPGLCWRSLSCSTHTDRFFASEGSRAWSFRGPISVNMLSPSSALRQLDIWKLLKLGPQIGASRPPHSPILWQAVYFYGALLLTPRHKIISLRLAPIIRASDSWQCRPQSVPVAHCQGQSPHRSKNRSSCHNLPTSRGSTRQGSQAPAFRKFPRPPTDAPRGGD